MPSPERSPLEVYRLQADSFADFAENSLSWQYIEQPAFDTYLGKYYQPDSTFLDLGSGTGRIVQHLINRGIPASNICALEPTEALLAIAQAKTPQATYVRANAVDIPFQNEKFDVVTANMLIHYLDHDQLRQCLDDVYRVLRPGGIFFLVGVDYAHSQEAIDAVEQWSTQRTPWNSEVPVYNHNIDNLILDHSYYAGLDMRAGILLTLNEAGMQVPKARERYANRYARFAARFHKVSQSEKQLRQQDITL